MILLITVALLFTIAVLVMMAARQCEASDARYEAYIVGEQAAHPLPSVERSRE